MNLTAEEVQLSVMAVCLVVLGLIALDIIIRP